MNFILDYDIEILRLIQENRLIYLDHFLYWISFTTTFVSIGILLSLAYQSFVKKKNSIKSIFFKMLSMFLAATTLSLILKYSIKRVRPFITYPDIEKLSEAGSYSFPSGHTAEAFTIAIGALLLFRKKRFFMSILTWAILVAYSRMTLGVHFPSDIIASIAVALVICISIKKYLKNGL
jgi:membrane-associated phospholipid phosphatase